MKALWHLNKYLIKYKWLLLVGALFVIVSVIFKVFPAVLIRDSFDAVGEAITRYQSNNQFDLSDLTSELIWYGLFIIGSTLLQGVFMFAMRQTIIVMSRHIEYDLKNEIYTQYQRLSMSFYKRNNTGDLMNRISEDVGRVRMYVGPAIMYALNTGALVLIVVFIMFKVNVKLTLLTLAPLPLLAWAIYKVSELINTRSHKVQEQLSTISTHSQETFSGIRIIKSFTREKAVLTDFTKEANEYSRVNERLYRVDSLFLPLMTMLIGLSTILTIYVGGLLYIDNSISAGNIAEFIYYVNILTWPVASIGWVTSIVQRAAASQERINEFLDVKPDIQNPNTPITSVAGRITFKDVSFVYPDSGIRALNNVSFDLEAGKSLAIIGKTGSGKSTVAALIGRLFDPTSGEIDIDGNPLKDFNLDTLRKNIGYVPQEGFLFSDSIANNIGFGLDDVTQAQIEEAAREAEIHENIMGFPKAYETRVGERGVTLSGGQKQRVSIARAIIKKPSILIFDDSLSAVDTETEENILQNLKQIIAQRTTVIISHRVSSVKHCDDIIVLDKGAIIEKGSHQTLLEQNGYYAELYSKQLEESSSSVL
jgi:ATP-binding cassette subfamily B protein